MPRANRTLLVVGAGLAGASAAGAARERGFDGRVVLIGAEPTAPYERRPLSKDVLRGTAPDASALVHADAYYADNAIEPLTSTEVVGLDVVAG